MLYTALIFGIISSFHCVGMCGPIAMMLPVDHKNQVKKNLQIATYHIGRLTAYAILGFSFGILGRGFYFAGIQQYISIIVGILMIVIVIIPKKTFVKYNYSKPVYKLISKIKSSLGNQFKKKSFDALFTIGLFNGFLPCGLVYAALFGAIAMQNIALSTSYMFLFGLGTIPLMTAVVYFSEVLKFPIRSKMQKIIPVITIIIGTLFILRGLGLNIDYISPSNLSLYVQANANCHK